MILTCDYNSPIGNILIASSKEKLIGIWFDKQRYYKSTIKEEIEYSETSPILRKTKNWLDRYFKGEQPSIDELDLNLIGSDFRIRVWQILKTIPYGKTITYKEIATMIAKEKKVKTISCQAVGNAVGHNPLSIVIPCHRVIGSNNSLAGYAGDLDKKIFLLKLEGIDTTKLSIPKEEKYGKEKM